MVNLELYKIFALVAREKNITKASEILHISQPAVTNHIKNLESDLNLTNSYYIENNIAFIYKCYSYFCRHIGCEINIQCP